MAPLTRIEAAVELGVSLRTLERLIADHALPVVRIGRRVTVRQAAIDRYLDHAEGYKRTRRRRATS